MAKVNLDEINFIRELVRSGQISIARKKIRELLNETKDEEIREKLLLEDFKIDVLLREYSVPLDHAFEKFKEEFKDVTKEEFETLVKEGKFDFVQFDGKFFFFKDFIFNFLKFNTEWEKRRTKLDENLKKSREFLFNHQDDIVRSFSLSNNNYIPSVKFRIKHTIKIKPGAIPEGEKVRIWIPLPRKCEINKDIKIIGFYPSKPYVSHENIPQRTAYFETYMDKNGLTAWLEYEYTSIAYYNKIDQEKVEDYDESSDIFLEYTSEKPPHIVFTDRLIKLEKEITGNEKNPYKKARSIFFWIIRNVTYNLPYEYVLYENIPEYVAVNKRGDCGMQALLFITLCRISGIPARWQSGFYANPLRLSLHDWAQFYIEPFGWLYADPSFGGSMPEERKEFYFGNIDAFRMAANNDISTQFDPPKKKFRSDPVDNQRGEVEWKEGNLFYDKWDHEIKIISYDYFLRKI